MKLHPHTKKQLISLGIMVIIFVVTVIYSIGYFDFTFINRPSENNQTPSTQRQEHTTSPEKETAYDENYYGEEFGENFEYFEEFEEFENLFEEANNEYTPD